MTSNYFIWRLISVTNTNVVTLMSQMYEKNSHQSIINYKHNIDNYILYIVR